MKCLNAMRDCPQKKISKILSSVSLWKDRKIVTALWTPCQDDWSRWGPKGIRRKTVGPIAELDIIGGWCKQGHQMGPNCFMTRAPDDQLLVKTVQPTSKLLPFHNFGESELTMDQHVLVTVAMWRQRWGAWGGTVPTSAAADRENWQKSDREGGWSRDEDRGTEEGSRESISEHWIHWIHTGDRELKGGAVHCLLAHTRLRRLTNHQWGHIVR